MSITVLFILCMNTVVWFVAFKMCLAKDSFSWSVFFMLCISIVGIVFQAMGL